MLIDEVEITIKAGHGGAGKVAFYPAAKGGPCGGNGGRGGDVYIKATSDLTALNQFSRIKVLGGENGRPGESNRKSGSNGQDLTLIMPVGSELVEKVSGEVTVLTEPNQIVLVAKGGLGGRGNFEFKSPRNTTPKFAQPGLPGEAKYFKVFLKLIADFGLIGLPSSGKSSILNELTLANVKTAEYPFTTLEPNLGMLEGKVIADIPGLIEGASSGKGLGIKFLKHIEKVKVLLHCITVDSENPLSDYQVIWDEMKKYNPDLAKKDEIVLLTKTDLVSKDELKKKITELKKLKRNIIPVSIYDFESIEKLKVLLTAIK